MKQGSRYLVSVLKYIVAVALLAFVVAMNWSQLKELFARDPQPEIFVAVFVGMVVVVLTQYIRWYLLVRAVDLPFTTWNAIRLGLVGTFYNTFLPGAIGGDFVKAYLIAKGQPGRQAAAASTVVMDRLLGLFGLILYAAVVGGYSYASGDERIISSKPLTTITFVCIGLASCFILGYTFFNLLPDSLGARLNRIRPVFGQLWDTAKRFRAKPRTILLCVLLSAISHTAMMFSFHGALQIFPPEDRSLIASVPETFTIAPLGFIAQALIPLPGGIGVSEFTFGGLYRLIRGEAGTPVGLAGRLALRLVEWVIGLVGYIAYLWTKGEIPTDAETPPGA
ncbi:MAG: lysylphosphatidylglycerol synthase transmembrane domain-containing protein [Fimbriiglobus sp.]